MSSSENPRFSLITTVRGGEKFFPQYLYALKRLRARSEIEVVLADDNPVVSPHLKSLVSDLRAIGYAVKEVHVGGKGRAQALNQALDAATCRYCLILDIDDIPFNRRFEILLRDIRNGSIGAINLYSGYYGYPNNRTSRLRKIPKPLRLQRAVMRGMPLPHTFMTIDKQQLGTIRYQEILAGIDYRLVSDAYIAGLRVNLSHERVGIHMKYPDSSFATRPQIQSQLCFLSTQARLLLRHPSPYGLFYALGRILRLPIFAFIDARKRGRAS